MFGMGGRKPQPQPTPEKQTPPARKAAAVKVTVSLSRAQKDKLERLGGEAWLREQIDRAEEPDPPCRP